MKWTLPRFRDGLRVGCFLLLAISTDAWAQAAPAFQYSENEEAAALAKRSEVEWKASAQGGLIVTTGNSRVTTFSSGFNTSRRAHGNKLALEGGAAYARSSIFLAVDQNASGTIDASEIQRPEQTTTRAYFIKGRYDRFLTERNSLYVATGAAADRPAGKELVGNGQVGYSRALLVQGKHQVTAEVGYDFTHEDLVAGDGVSIHSGRAFMGYAGQVGGNTSLDTSIEYLSNVNELDTPGGTVAEFQDVRMNYKLSLTTELFGDLSFRIGFEAKYDAAPAPRPPFALPYQDGFVPLAEVRDTKTEATLIYNFL